MQSPEYVTVDWRSYHDDHCNDHDFCGAVQGSGGGEDIHSFLQAVDASLIAPVVAQTIQRSSDVPECDMASQSEVCFCCCTSWTYSKRSLQEDYVSEVSTAI